MALPHPKIVERDGCWIWTGSQNGGYGQVKVDGRTRYTHRHFYELLIGPIPEGLQIDHLCKQTTCCNPEHLEPVTPAENNRRSDSPSALHARQTRCVNGHELTEDNVYRRPNGARRCRTCTLATNDKAPSRQRKAVAS